MLSCTFERNSCYLTIVWVYQLVFFLFSFYAQAATALQRNTRPSTHDAPLPVYGQETVGAVPLPRYRAGKVCFFCLTPAENYNMIIWQCTRTFGAWTSYFPCPKKGKSQFPLFFCFPGNYYCRIFAFLWTQTREEGFISWSKESFFLAGQPREIMITQDVAILPTRVANQNRGFALSIPLARLVIVL